MASLGRAGRAGGWLLDLCILRGLVREWRRGLLVTTFGRGIEAAVRLGRDTCTGLVLGERGGFGGCPCMEVGL